MTDATRSEQCAVALAECFRGDGEILANPIGTIASLALLLRHGLKQAEPAQAIEKAIHRVLAEGARTRDIARPGDTVLGTRAMAERIVAALG